jgi:hypothetical protein
MKMRGQYIVLPQIELSTTIVVGILAIESRQCGPFHEQRESSRWIDMDFQFRPRSSQTTTNKQKKLSREKKEETYYGNR